MALMRKVLSGFALASALAGTSVAVAGDADAVAHAPARWSCQHLIHEHDQVYKGTCENVPENQKFQLVITCKDYFGRYKNAYGQWVDGYPSFFTDPKPYSTADCGQYPGFFYDGSYEYLGS